MVLINKLAAIRSILLGGILGLFYHENVYRRRVVSKNLPFVRVDGLYKPVSGGHP